MLGILLALALSQQPQKTCTVVNFGPATVRLVCGKDEGNIDTADWPTEQWGRAKIGDSYPMTADGERRAGNNNPSPNGSARNSE